MFLYLLSFKWQYNQPGEISPYEEKCDTFNQSSVMGGLHHPSDYLAALFCHILNVLCWTEIWALLQEGG